MYKQFIIALAGIAALTGCTAKPTLKSPDGSVTVNFALNEAGMPTYSVAVGGDTLIAPSALGVVTKEWSLPQNAKYEVLHSTFNEEWDAPWGETTHHVNHYNEMAVAMNVGDASTLTIRFRAFDDGIAFRYELDMEGTSWSIPANFETYELKYREMPISEVTDANTPFTFCVSDSLYGAIHEAALYDYPEMNLRSSAPGAFKADLAPLPDGVKAYIPAKFVTPWRTMQIARQAVGLINSDLILNLNEPSKIADTSWIAPQKYVGIWWGMHLGTQTWTMGPRHGATTENAIKYIDFAANNNLQGVLFEGWNEGWDNWGGTQHFNYMKAYADFDIDSIAAYAKAKGIELWMHDETGGNVPEFEASLDSTFAYYQSLGVHTVKTGYAGGFKGGYLHHSQYGVRHYQKVVETAAAHQIMIDAHEPIKDTGIRRTWPNMMTREGARGMEWNAWSEGNDAGYLCTLPFVRLLGGPMDYTPGIFDIDYSLAKADKGRIEWNGPNGDCCIKTTLARQIANWVIIYSPLQMAADLIENYQGHPAFEFFRDFNANCDHSQALQGAIGKYIVVMRHAGDRYFIGAGTNGEARTLSQPLSFLDKGVTYEARIYADEPGNADPEAVLITKQTVTSADTLSIVMNATGGQAITFIPLK
jgi:alpha-glucosidase